MTRSVLEYLLAKHVATAARREPSIARKRVTPHVLRHTCAMHTLRATRDVRKISLWLGHASLQSTKVYLRADPSGKLEALAAMAPPILKPGCFRASETLGDAEDGRPPVQLCGVNALRELRRAASTRRGLHIIMRST